ncbi:MAG TPA: DEAD/DEAH box helicase [Polyangia bacterium]|nr:DEAD/DEAH box helicase [Polyangia bacterium]
MPLPIPPSALAPSAPAIPPPPERADDLSAWAETHGVAARLDDLVIGDDGPAGTLLPARSGEVLTYRQVLLDGAGTTARRGFDDTEESVRRVLHRMATLVVAARDREAWLQQHGRDPEDPVLAAFAAKLSAALDELEAARPGAARPPGTFEPGDVRVITAPVPALQYREWPLVGARRDSDDGSDGVYLYLLGWNDGPLRWGRARGGRPVEASEPPADIQRSALQAIVDDLRDPRRAVAHEALADLLRVPAWQFALGTLDQTLSRLEADAGAGGGDGTQERVAFRVTAASDGGLTVTPTIQKRVRGGAFSRGARVQWYELPERRDLTPAERRAYQAYDDRFARRSQAWGGALSPAQLFGIFRALIDHPAVFLDGGRDGQADGPRLDIRQGRLLLRFATAADGNLTPHFALLGQTMTPAEVAAALRDDRHVIHLLRPDDGAPQLLLAQIGPQAAAMVRALALAPARFPPESHDALAARLESLQETVDIEFPSTWTRTIAAADGRLVVRLQLAASGALEVRLGVRPVRLGPVFVPGEGPALVLEGQGRDRHGARRDRATERQSGHALAERLGLEAGTVQEPWCWRVPEGDPALHLVATLKELEDTVVVEWADDYQLLSLGTIGRRDMRMKVADRRDWFDIEGGAQIKKQKLGKGGKDRGAKDADQVVPLAALFAAIRDGRRYVAVGAQGFVRIEESLREALARAEGAVFEKNGIIQIAAVASDPLLGLVEQEEQLEASVAFTALRRRLRAAATAVEQPLRLPAALQAALRPYQSAGAAWMARLAEWGAGAILADEMGLGKTIQTLALLIHRAATGPALVVAPTSVVSNWADEAARFAPQLGVRLYRGPQRESALRGLGPGDLVLTSYAVAALDGDALARVRFGSLVLDEAQAIKNATTERAKALRALDADWRLGLTGTPIENHLGELWSLMRVLSPGLLGSWEQFRARYAVPIEKFGDDSRRRSLATLLRPFVLRRTKGEVARELPARTEVVRVVPLSPAEQALYEQMRQATLDELREAKKNPDRDGRDLRFVLLAALTRLRQLCCHPRLLYPHTHAGSAKASHLLDLLFELREGGHKALVFSQFRSFLELLAPRLQQQGLRVLVLDGTTPTHVRDERIAAFQSGAADVFLISLKAGGFGLNLTAADTVILMDPWWNPAVEDQASARAHRIGQRNPVTTVRLVARGTIEEAVLGLHAAKRSLAAGVLDGTDVAASLPSDELIGLIQRGGELSD